MLSKARTAARIDSSRLTIVASSGGTVVLFAALFVVNYVLHAPSVVVWFFAALFGWISLWFAIAAITTPGRVMLQSMQDYEEVTGKTVIPEDIRSIVETSDAR